MTSFLKKIRVIETANFVSGPYVGQLLADLGAEVIKIENPKGGDPFRSLSPDGYSADFCSYNTGKKSVGIDLTKPEGRALVEQLAKTSDVLVENFRPGVMDRLQLGWDRIHAANPRLVYCSMTGFGRDGPYQHRPAYNSVAGALSGFFSQLLDKDHPQIVGPALCDAVTGLYGAYAVLGALLERGQTGEGKRIDVTMMEAMIAFLRQPIMNYIFTGQTPAPLDRPGQIDVLRAGLCELSLRRHSFVDARQILAGPAAGNRKAGAEFRPQILQSKAPNSKLPVAE